MSELWHKLYHFMWHKHNSHRITNSTLHGHDLRLGQKKKKKAQYKFLNVVSYTLFDKNINFVKDINFFTKNSLSYILTSHLYPSHTKRTSMYCMEFLIKTSMPKYLSLKIGLSSNPANPAHSADPIRSEGPWMDLNVQTGRCRSINFKIRVGFGSLDF